MQSEKKEITTLLKTAKGQIEGILNMVNDDRYCLDIITQIMACEGVLNSASRKILSDHLKTCVANADTKEEKDEKIDELILLMSKIIK